MSKPVPFYENPDRTHCFQAVLRMILKYYWPTRDFTWDELDKITAKVDGLWTWPTAAMLWLHNNGFEVRDVETFDYAQFAKKGGNYLIDLLGKKVGQEQINHSDIAQEIGYAKQLLRAGLPERRMPDCNELKECLGNHYLLICNVNSRTMNGKEGYAGHFVLLTNYSDKALTIHDPGPVGVKDRRISFEEFERAWAYPDDQAKNYIAIRRRR